jgi:hypothetical protein
MRKRKREERGEGGGRKEEREEEGGVRKRERITPWANFDRHLSRRSRGSYHVQNSKAVIQVHLEDEEEEEGGE